MKNGYEVKPLNKGNFKGISFEGRRYGLYCNS